MEEKAAIDQKKKIAGLTAIVGAALLFIGLFLPWMSAGIISATGNQKVQNDIILLVLAAAFGLAGFLNMTSKKNYGFLIKLCSLGCLIYLAIIYVQMIDVAGGRLLIAYGFYISEAGAFIGLTGGVMSAQKKGKKPEEK